MFPCLTIHIWGQRSARVLPIGREGNKDYTCIYIEVLNNFNELLWIFNQIIELYNEL